MARLVGADSAQAACQAVARSGLEMKDIDGILTSSLTSPWWVMRMAEYLGIRPRFSDSTMFGGSSFIADLKVAALAIAAGECDNVLVCYGDTPRSAPSSSKLNQVRAELDPQPYEDPCKPFNPVSSTRWPRRGTCINTAPRGASSPRSRWRRGSGPGSILMPSRAGRWPSTTCSAPR